KTTGEGAPEAIPALDRALVGQADLVREIEIAKRVAARRWDLQLKSGMVVRLPSDENLATAITYLAKTNQRGKILSRAVATLDLRVDGQMVMTPLSGRSSEEAA
ncbi:MAG: cell division protein FtsQ/DivIB, partial [Pseudomonadota bacterium]